MRSSQKGQPKGLRPLCPESGAIGESSSVMGKCGEGVCNPFDFYSAIARLVKGVSKPFSILFWIVDEWGFSVPEGMIGGEDVDAVFIVDVAVFVDFVDASGVVET